MFYLARFGRNAAFRQTDCSDSSDRQDRLFRQTDCSDSSDGQDRLFRQTDCRLDVPLIVDTPITGPQGFAGGHLPACWEARHHKHIRAVFSALWDTRQLVTSIDGFNAERPGNTPLSDAAAIVLHSDQNPYSVQASPASAEAPRRLHRSQRAWEAPPWGPSPGVEEMRRP